MGFCRCQVCDQWQAAAKHGGTADGNCIQHDDTTVTTEGTATAESSTELLTSGVAFAYLQVGLTVRGAGGRMPTAVATYTRTGEGTLAGGVAWFSK